MKLRKFVAIAVVLYVLLATYVMVEQDRTIQSQQVLIVELFKDAVACAGSTDPSHYARNGNGNQTAR